MRCIGESILTPPTRAEHIGRDARLKAMRRTAVIWLAGCIAWTVDFVANLVLRHTQHAQLALIMAILFGIAYAFYRTQSR